MTGELPEFKEEQKGNAGANSSRELLSADAIGTAPQKFNLKLSSTDLLQVAPPNSLSIETKHGIANFLGTASAGVSGTIAWSVAERALGNSPYALAGKLAASVLTGALTRVASKGSVEMALLEPKDYTTSINDFAWGGVDALSAIAAVKAEQSFSSAWQTNLGKVSGAQLSHEAMLEQGRKILAGDIGKRLVHNTIRGMVGGGTGALAWSAPHEIAANFDTLNSTAGWQKTGRDIAGATIFGTVTGGMMMGVGTTLWNAREIAGVAKASLLGKQGRYALDVYHFNDGHSSLLGDRSTLPQLATKAEELRAVSAKNGTASAVLDLGDAHSGNAAAVTSNTGQIEQELIHEHIKVTASVPGNHSADTGLYSGDTKDVAQWIKNMNNINARLQEGAREVPGVAANVQSVIDPSFVGETSNIYKPYRVFVDPKTGDKVGLVGLVTDQLQNATPKLLDADLAIASAKYGELTFKQFVSGANSSKEAGDLVQKLSTNKFLQNLAESHPDEKLANLIDRVNTNQYTKGLSPAAQSNWRNWFELAGKEPEAKLGELAARHPENDSLSQLATLYPEKRIADLHQIMVTDPGKALENSVQALKQDGVNKVVVLSHLGKASDLKLAQEGPRVAAIFGGHSHDLEPVPLFVKNNDSGASVLVSQAGHSYGWLGEAKLVFNNDGSLNRYLSSGKMHAIDETVAPMSSALKAVESHMQAHPQGSELLQSLSEKHAITVKNEISLDEIRGQHGTQTPLANLLVSAYKEGGDKVLPAVNASREAAGLPKLGDSIDAVLVQSGGIRAGLPAGPVLDVNLQTMFMNTPTLVEMDGAQIQKTLSYGVHDFPSSQKSEGLFGSVKELYEGLKRDHYPLADFDASGKNVIAGQLKFTVDRTRPSYDRAQAVQIWDQATQKYVPIDPAKKYTVMTVSHLLGRIGNTPMIPASELRGRSLGELGSQYWVLGRRFEPSVVSETMNPSNLPTASSRNFLLDYLKSHSNDGTFSMPAALLQSPVRDLSPGTWVPQLKPTADVAVTLGTVAAAQTKAESKAESKTKPTVEFKG